jgi:hypothetical protein
MEWVDRFEPRIALAEAVPIQQKVDSLADAHPEVVGAMRADPQIALELAVEDLLIATRAFGPRILRTGAAAEGKLDRHGGS